MRLFRIPAALVAFALVALVGGCGAKKDPVQALLGELEAAAEDRSADAFGKHLADDFRGQGGIGRAEATAQLRRYFAAYEKVELDVYDVKVQRHEGAADVTLRVDFSGHPLSVGGLSGLLPPDAAYRFELHVVEQAGTWKAQRAAWEEAAPPEPAAPGR